MVYANELSYSRTHAVPNSSFADVSPSYAGAIIRRVLDTRPNIALALGFTFVHNHHQNDGHDKKCRNDDPSRLTITQRRVFRRLFLCRWHLALVAALLPFGCERVTAGSASLRLLSVRVRIPTASRPTSPNALCFLKIPTPIVRA